MCSSDLWAAMAPADRKTVLVRWAQLIEDHADEIALLECLDAGKPITDTSGGDVPAAARTIRWSGEAIDKVYDQVAPTPANCLALVQRLPLGVVAAIVPWNFPIEIILNKLGPLLAMGNTCVLKPAPDTPWNATRLGRLIAEQTDIPPGVVNIVTSADHLVGEVLSTSAEVDMVAFTGSTATGRRILEAAAPTLKRVFLELGGKSVNLVLDDADLEATLAGSAVCCMHGGQGCAIPTRLLVPRSHYDEAVEMARTAFENWAYGDPTDLSVLQGPQISRRQQERVLDYIQQGRAEGATVVTGGGRPDHLDRGWYVEPTLFADVDNAMVIAQEEIFGPVLRSEGRPVGKECSSRRPPDH